MPQSTATAKYFRPENLEESLALLAQRSLRVVAGATDVYPARVAGRTWGGAAAESWLDISAVASLASITRTQSGWRIGALVTWSELVAADLPVCFSGLKAAAREVGGLQIQNRATLVGNLCNASPAADGVPPLLCLNATVELASESGTRELPLAEFILGNRQTARQPSELVTAIIVPVFNVSSNSHTGMTDTDELVAHSQHNLDSRFFKLGARKYLVISIVMAAGIVQWDDNKNLTDCRFSVGSCSPVAVRLPALENDLLGLNLDDLAQGRVNLRELVAAHHVQQLSPIDDVRADAAYRHQAAIACLTELLESHVKYYTAAGA